jgi:hypothetical protein
MTISRSLPGSSANTPACTDTIFQMCGSASSRSMIGTSGFMSFAEQLATASDNSFQVSVSDKSVFAIYWDFDAMLNASSSALDALARILTTAHKEHTPPSFSRLAAKPKLSVYASTFLSAKSRWVQRMKDYRDCFVHYTSVDTHLSCSCTRYGREREVRCKLPVNPNARDIIAFRWSRRHDVLSYAISLWRHIAAFDRKIAAMLRDDWKRSNYPARTDHLFSVGQRTLRESKNATIPAGGEARSAASQTADLATRGDRDDPSVVSAV